MTAGKKVLDINGIPHKQNPIALKKKKKKKGPVGCRSGGNS